MLLFVRGFGSFDEDETDWLEDVANVTLNGTVVSEGDHFKWYMVSSLGILVYCKTSCSFRPVDVLHVSRSRGCLLPHAALALFGCSPCCKPTECACLCLNTGCRQPFRQLY